jgi:probable phosphoglycerate mutase
MTTLLLARHASHSVVHTALSGRSPGVRLSEAGRAEAAALARLARRRAPAALFTSPQPRAWETAEIISTVLGMPPLVEDALDEIDFGDWTGRLFADLDADPRWAAWNTGRATARPPGGEAMHEAQSRVLRWIETLHARHAGTTVLAVSHADVIKAALLAHLGLTLDAHHRLDVAPASLSALDIWPGGGRLRFLNDVPESPA